MSTIERVPLHELKEGQTAEFFAAIMEIEEKTTRNGDPFFKVVLRDQKKSMPCSIWFNSAYYELFKHNWVVGRHLFVRGTYDKKYTSITLLEAREICDADYEIGYDPNAFERGTRFDVDAMFEEVLSYIAKIGDEPLKRLVQTIFEKNEKAFKAHPAAARNHHAYRGGLLEHTLSVVRTGEYFATKYSEYYPELQPPLNTDLIIAGCLLHDIGKLEELTAGVESVQYTRVGNLIGHVIVGRDIVRDAAREIPELDGDLLLLLEHIILSHQMTKEWDSPKEPAFPEALLVHFADDTDAKMNMYHTILAGTSTDAEFSDANNLFRRRLLKKRTV